ncbi:MAG: rhodanese-like domain-containing protein [Acidobacteriia bacterium]|nr:rhodanese-like domain-containing protein [Terriglobia bacterium]
MNTKKCFHLLAASILWAGFNLAVPAQHMTVVPNAPRTSAQALHSQINQGQKVLILDVRVPAEYARGHVPDALNIPLENFEKEFLALHVPKTTTVVTVCDKGGRSSHAVVLLQKLGYSASSYCTLESWKSAGYKVESGGAKPVKPNSK